MSHEDNTYDGYDEAHDDPVYQSLSRPQEGSLNDPLLDESDTMAAKREKALEEQKEGDARKTRLLVLSFILMVVIGSGNKIFSVLQLQPMYNYPLFVSVLTTFIYVPFSYAYIIPMIMYGSQITKEAQEIPKYKFAVMGLLDCIAGIMQTLATTYIDNGSLVFLLTQAAIPISMIISYIFLKTRYKISQYIGAIVVLCGIVVVLLPSLTGGQKSSGKNPVLWAIILIASCIPMCLSSVYKEKSLGETEIDAIYLNGWVAVFQFFASLPLLVPSAPPSNVDINYLPNNIWQGARCFVQLNTVDEYMASVNSNLRVDDCAMAPIYSCLYMAFNLMYNVLIILILKYGSSNILWLAMTVMVPLGNFTFALNFVPKHRPLDYTNIIGLVIIMLGLITYRFWGKLWKRFQTWRTKARPLGDVQPSGTPDSPFFGRKQDSSEETGAATPMLKGAHSHTTKAHHAEQPAAGGPSSRASSRVPKPINSNH